MANTIVLQGNGGKHEEGVLTAAVKPGNTLAMGAGTLTLGADDQDYLMVACEDALQGKTIKNAYAIGDRAFYYRPVPGDVLQVLAPAATYNNGAPLQCLPSGLIGAEDTGPVVAVAEAVDAGIEDGANNQVISAQNVTDGDNFLRVRVV